MSSLPLHLEPAREELAKLYGRPDFDVVAYARYGGQDRFRERFSLTTEEYAAVSQAAGPRAKADRFKWIEAVTRCRSLTERGLRVAMALFSRMGDERYVWPSQRWIAAHIGYTNERDVRKGLEQLVEIGALRKVRNCDLPPDVASKVMGSGREGGSGRTARGISYAAVPPEYWL